MTTVQETGLPRSQSVSVRAHLVFPPRNETVDTNKTPFLYRHVVKWGECDPAGIIYTPRVIDFVLEAIEAWYQAVLGISWTELRNDRNTGVPMVRAECDFTRPPTPGLE